MHKLIEHTQSGGFSLVKGTPAFQIKFNSANGEITFGATKMVGFRFPGFEDECGPIEGGEPDEMPEFTMPAMPELLPVENNDYEDIPATES